jgi:hypothetical protein
MKIILELNMGTDSGALVAVIESGVNNLKRLAGYTTTDMQRVAIHNGIAVGEQFIKQIEAKAQALVDESCAKKNPVPDGNFTLTPRFTNCGDDGNGNQIGNCSRCGCNGVLISEHKCKPDDEDDNLPAPWKDSPIR